MSISFSFAVPLPTALAGTAGNALAGMPAQVSDGTLTDAEEIAPYIFDRNSVGHNACNGVCPTSWPPLMANDGNRAGGDHSLILRDDGDSTGKPLYRSVKTRKADEKTGDGVNSAWHGATR